MPPQYQAAVLHRAGAPLAIERVEAMPLAAADVLVRVRAAPASGSTPSTTDSRRCGAARRSAAS